MVARYVARNLVPPEFRTRLREGSARATLVAMPEAPVDEYRQPMPRQHDVRRARQIAHMKSESEASMV